MIPAPSMTLFLAGVEDLAPIEVEGQRCIPIRLHTVPVPGLTADAIATVDDWQAIADGIYSAVRRARITEGVSIQIEER